MDKYSLAEEYKSFHIQLERAALHMFVEGQFPLTTSKDTLEMVDMVKKLLTPAVVAYLGQVLFSVSHIPLPIQDVYEDNYFKHMLLQKDLVIKGLENESKKDAQYLIDKMKELTKGDNDEQD